MNCEKFLVEIAILPHNPSSHSNLLYDATLLEPSHSHHFCVLKRNSNFNGANLQFSKCQPKTSHDSYFTGSHQLTSCPFIRLLVTSKIDTNKSFHITMLH